jgi:S1-C subfamily serine protease
MKLLCGIFCAICLLPAMAADKITAVTVDGVSYTEIQDAHVVAGGRVVLHFPGGVTTANADKMPGAFLDSWGITAAQISLSKAAAERQAEQALTQAIAAGFFRKVDDVIYDLRKPQTNWTRLSGAKVLQVGQEGALLELSSDQPTPAFVFLRHAPAGVSDHDTITVAAKLAGTFSYIDRSNYERTLRAYDSGRACQRNEIPPAMLKEGLASLALPDAAKPRERTIGSLEGDPRLRGIGSGFFVTKDGYLLTNHHVVKDAEKVEVEYQSHVFRAKVIEVDKDNDLALLKVEGGSFPALSISRAESADLGQEVFTIGFPNIVMQGIAPKYTDGKISSLAGMMDDPTEYQISVPVQPGNSGGPLCDANGQVVGIVVARLNDLTVLQASGAVPQNVNYAVKARHALRLLQRVKGLESSLSQAGKPANAVKTVENAVVMVKTY